MLDLDALTDLDNALSELSHDERPWNLSSMAQAILNAPAENALQCPHLARVAAK